MTAQLAHARAALATAESAHTDALAKVAGIESRITECQRHQREITQQRLEGEANHADAAEFTALAGDIETLAGMLIKARQDADALRPDEARNQLAHAMRQHDKDVAMAEMDALMQKAAQLDAALCRCVGAMHQIGRAKFQHVAVSQSWRPSTELDRCLRLGVPPTGA